MNSMLNLTPEVEQLANLCKDNSRINSQLYIEKHVKRGLRDIDGNGVVAGLTNISEIISKKQSMEKKFLVMASFIIVAMIYMNLLKDL